MFRKFPFAIALAACACGTRPHPDGPENARVDSDADASGEADRETAIEVGTGESGPDEMLRAIRNAADGSMAIDLIGVTVTYARPGVIGDDMPGFFVQAGALGPALFVDVDPALLKPHPRAGDSVSFRADEKQTRLDASIAIRAISNFRLLRSTGDVSGLVQDVSTSVDLATALDDYESELLRITQGQIESSFRTAGFDRVFARFDTRGVAGGLDLRIPGALQRSVGLELGCTLDVESTPLLRQQKRPMAAAWFASELRNVRCPAPRVISAAAPNATHVVIRFDRPIQPASIALSGSQFLFDRSLVASSAIATEDAYSVDVTTREQVAGSRYVIQAASTITDPRGAGVDPVHADASFLGGEPKASLRINELDANVPNGCDRIELRILARGNLAGWKIKSRRAVLLVFPRFHVEANDLIVVHTNGWSQACNPSRSGNETDAIDEFPAAAYSDHFDEAYDWYTTGGGISTSDTVITLYDEAGRIEDAILAADGTKGPVTIDSERQAEEVAGEGAWTTPQGTIPLGGFIDEGFRSNAVLDLALSGTTTTTDLSIQRLGDDDWNSRVGWSTSAASWGRKNVGQSDF